MIKVLLTLLFFNFQTPQFFSQWCNDPELSEVTRVPQATEELLGLKIPVPAIKTSKLPLFPALS